MATPEKQLNNLKRIKPDNSWKQENRSVLYNQISNSYTEEKQSLADRFREAFIGLRDSFSKPAWAVAIITALVITGGLGVQATQYSKPGDTLYFTKKLSEKLKLALTFDEQEKAKMSIQFSSGHARDITETLSDPTFNEESAGELQDSFRAELISVRQKLDAIAMADKEEEQAEPKEKEGDTGNEAEQQGRGEDTATAERQQEQQQDNQVSNEQEEGNEPAERETADQGQEEENEGKTDQNIGEEESDDDNNNEGERLAEEDSGNTATDTDTSMFIMDFGKQEDGQDIYIPEQNEDEDKEGKEVHQQMEEAGQKLENNKDEVDESSLPELYELLDRAVEQFNAGNYEETKLLLEEFSEKFNNFQADDEESESGDSNNEGDEGEVKGVSEEATSTNSDGNESNESEEDTSAEE